MRKDAVVPTEEACIVFQILEQKTYPPSQRSTFVPFRSAIDALFEIDPDATRDLIADGTREPTLWREWISRARGGAFRRSQVS